MNLEFVIVLLLQLELRVSLREPEEDLSHGPALEDPEEQGGEAGHPGASAVSVHR